MQIWRCCCVQVYCWQTFADPSDRESIISTSKDLISKMTALREEALEVTTECRVRQAALISDQWNSDSDDESDEDGYEGCDELSSDERSDDGSDAESSEESCTRQTIAMKQTSSDDDTAMHSTS